MLAFSSVRDDIKIPDYERTAYKAADQILSLNGDSQRIDGSVLPTVVPTLGGIIRSLQPVQFSGLTYGYGPTQSTRDNIMVGGNGSASGGQFMPFNSGFLSPFNAAYGYATNSALNQAGFGDQLFGGVTSLLYGVSTGVGALSNAANMTLGTTAQLANIVTLGNFKNTQFAREIGKLQENVSLSRNLAYTAANSANQLRHSVNYTSATLGSLLNFSV